jgi:hypothetical protein
MESNVEKIRMELQGNDLSRKLAVLSRVWALEVAPFRGASALSEVEPDAESTSELNRRKRVKKHSEESSN